MFIRRKKNASGSTSVLILEKRDRSNVVLKTIGTSSDAVEIEHLYKRAIKEMERLQLSRPLPFDKAEELAFVDSFTDCIESFSLVGPELLLGKIFDEIGFNVIADELFRHLVITRLVYPVSKLKTVDYLAKYKSVQLRVYSIYRYLDKLQKHQIEQIKSISLQHTLQLLGNQMSIVFYDVTTLYFESKEEDDFKRMGFSKDGKLTKQHINNKGYNKYLKIEGEASISIDKEKYNDDKKWDGLKGYRTNTSLSKEEVIEQYHQLWQIEKAFRISKNDLQIRPIYHQLKRRIEAHICIAFAACKIYKELERQLKEMKTGQSPEQAIDILKTIYSVEFETPYSTKKYRRLILKTNEQKELIGFFKLNI